MIECPHCTKPILIATLPIELTNGNDGSGGAWFKSATRRKRYEKVLRELGHVREPFTRPVAVLVTRILGPRQQLWDSSSGLRGSYKELEDALVAVGWFVDDSAKWITETRFRQDSTQRKNGPAKERPSDTAGSLRSPCSDPTNTVLKATQNPRGNAMESVYSPSGIPYAWMFYPDAYDEIFSAGASQTISHLRVAWEDAGSLKADLMYSAQRNPGKNHLIRNNPISHPEVEWHYLQQMNKHRLFHRAKPEVLPGSSGYGYATQEYHSETGFWAMDRIVYQCLFTPLPFNVRSDDQVKSQTIPELHRYCTGLVIPQTVNRKMPGLPFVMDELGADGKALPVPETASIPETTFKLVISLFGWPEDAVPYAAILDRSNKVNDASITIPPMGSFRGGTYAAETIRYDGLAGPIEPVIGSDGVRYVTIRHILNIHPISGGWNKTVDYRFNPPIWAYYKIENSDPPKRLYVKASMKELFIPT